MKNYLYDVVFGLDHINVYAGNPTDAAILAVAQRIKEGETTEIDSIYNYDTENFDVPSPCKLILMSLE